MVINIGVTVAISLNFRQKPETFSGILRVTVAKLAIELLVSRTAAVAEGCHAEVDIVEHSLQVFFLPLSFISEELEAFESIVMLGRCAEEGLGPGSLHGPVQTGRNSILPASHCGGDGAGDSGGSERSTSKSASKS